MATTLFTAWYDRVLTELAGVVQAFALLHIRDAAIEFCERSCIWIVDHAPIASVLSQGAYDYAPAAGTKVVKAMRAWYDKKPLEPQSEAQLSSLYSYWPGEEGQPTYFLSEQSDKLILVPKPAAALADAIRAKVALKPARDATGIETWIYEDYRDVIAAGAIARMKRMPGKPFTDLVGAAGNESIFETGVGKAKERAMKSLGRARTRVPAQFY